MSGNKNIGRDSTVDQAEAQEGAGLVQNADRRRIFAWAAVALAVLVNALALRPELAIGRVDLNDNVFHYTLIERMVQAITSGHNPLDCWSSEWALGHPVLRTYQPLAHLLVSGVYLMLGRVIPLLTVFNWVRYLSIVLLPLSFWGAARLIGLSRTAAAAAAALAPLVSTNFLYGIEYGSFTWAGSGLFPQAVATHLLLFAIGMGAVALRTGRRVLVAGVLVGLTALAHLIYGYIAGLTLVLLVLLPEARGDRRGRLARLGGIAGMAMLVSAFQILPLLADHAILSHSLWEPVWKWDSFGAAVTLTRLFTGELLDHGRLPVLTVLALAGVAVWAWRRRAGAAPVLEFVAAGAALWIAIYFGRPFWGPLLNVLGISDDMHLHRVIGGAHVFLVLLAGVALAELWDRLPGRGVAAVAITIVLFYPMVRERLVYLQQNEAWGRRTLQAYDTDRPDLNAAIAAAKSRGGRAYAGLAAGWGGQFKVGDAPVYAFLSTSQVPAVAFLYHSMALTGDVMLRFNDHAAAQYRLFNIKTAIAPVNWPLLPRAVAAAGARFGRFQLYYTPGNGYFDLVDAGAAVLTTRRNFYDINSRWLESDWVDKQTHLLLDFGEGAPAGLQRVEAGAMLPFIAAPPPSAGTVRAEQQNGEDYGAEIDVVRQSYLLFKMAWHPNWKAYVDGQAQPVVTLSPGFSAVGVTPGHHRVEFRYEPGWGKPLLALGGILAVVLIWLRGRQIGTALLSRMPTRIPRRVATAAGLIALSAPVLFRLVTGSLLGGHDAWEYFTRVEEAHRNFTAGTLLLRWAPDLSYGHGQPLFLFRPPLFYWIAEGCHLIGLSPIAAVNLAAALLVVAAAAAMFRLGKLYFGETGGWLAAAALLYAPYFAVDLYVRSAFEEFAAFPLIALVLYGFGAFAKEGRLRDWTIGACALGVLLCCHFPAALVFAPFLLAFVAFTAWLAGSWTLLAKQAAAIAAGLAIGAWSWLPALLEKQYVNMGELLARFHYAEHFVYPSQWFSTMWGYGLSVPGANDGMSFALGWSHLAIVAVAGVWAWRRPREGGHSELVFFVAAGALFCWMMVEDSAWVWERLRLLQFIAFPWRLLGPVAVCLAMAAAALGPALDSLGRWRGAALAAALALLIVPNLPHLAPPRLVDIDLAFWTPADMASRGVETTTAYEVTPRWMTYPALHNVGTAAAVIGDGSVRETDNNGLSWHGSVRAREAARVRLPFAYFPGWTARVDGHSTAAWPAQGSGLVEFAVGPGEHLVQAKFGRSTARGAGEAISGAALLAMVVAWRRRRGAGPVGLKPSAD
jgi:hypothetical protein